jgi:2,3-bisphosphoglycerate-dependent phosphoglycerate mutase
MQDPFLIQRARAAELFIVRHGDAIPEEDEIIPSGVYDDLPLSRIGREQSEALAARLRDTHFDAIYSSPLLRCRQTAAPLAELLRLVPILVAGIQEIRLGQVSPLPVAGGPGEPKDRQDLSSLTQALKDRQVDIVRLAGAAGNWDVFENSEPSKAFRKRVVEAMDWIAATHIGQRVIVFCHGGVINAYAAEVLGLERDFFFPAANASITVVRVAGRQRVLFVLNDVAHLKKPA